MKTKITFAILFLSYYSFAQLSSNSLHGNLIWGYANAESSKLKDRAEEVRKTTLYVLVDNKESEYGLALMKAFYKYWKFNKFEFTTTSESGKYITNEKNSVLAIARSSLGTFQGFVVSKGGVSKGASMEEYGFGIFLGGKKTESVEDATQAAYTEIYSNVYGIATGMNIISEATDDKIQQSLGTIVSFYILRLQHQTPKKSLQNTKLAY